MKKTSYKYTLNEIDEIAKSIVNKLHKKLVLFYGDMGSGKTTLINAILKAMKSNDVATSPTFSIVNEYTLPNDKIYHFDFYRIETVEDAFNFGIVDYLNSSHWLFIEWPERIIDILPENHITIHISTLDASTRTLELVSN